MSVTNSTLLQFLTYLEEILLYVVGSSLMLLGLIITIATCLDKPMVITASVLISGLGLAVTVIFLFLSNYINSLTFSQTYSGTGSVIPNIQATCCHPPSATSNVYVVDTSSKCSWLSLVANPNVANGPVPVGQTICDTPALFTLAVSNFISTVVLGYTIEMTAIAGLLLLGFLLNATIFARAISKMCRNCCGRDANNAKKNKAGLVSMSSTHKEKKKEGYWGNDDPSLSVSNF